MQPSDDSALLRQYVENHCDEAFATLVTRYVNLVYSVALRHVGHPQDAEEITQAVFVILARKAGELRHAKALSSWLFQVTRLTATNFVRSESRRHCREEEANMQSLLNEPSEEVWPKIAPWLDTAVANLREKDRQAIVLRFYEGRNLREVGHALGASEDAAEKRVSRALEKLRKFFAERGVLSTTAIIAETISANSIQGAPVMLAKSVTAVAIAKGATASSSTLILIKGALKIMAWTKAKTAMVVGIGILLSTATTIVTIKHIENKTQQEKLVRFMVVVNRAFDTKSPGTLLSLYDWEGVPDEEKTKTTNMVNGFFNPSFASPGPKINYTPVSIPKPMISNFLAGNEFTRNGIKYRPNLVPIAEVDVVGKNQSASGGKFTFALAVGEKDGKLLFIENAQVQ